MATSQPESITVDDDKMCSICHLQIKTPRYLPCKHFFCHDCISSDIMSQCKSPESCLGIHCKACGGYVPKVLQEKEYKGDHGSVIKVCPFCSHRFSTYCYHSFCTSCMSNVPRLGFKCPTCHEDTYIPEDGDPGKPEEWASLFPSNNIPQKTDEVMIGLVGALLKATKIKY